MSTQIAALRRLLLGKIEGDAGMWFGKVSAVIIPPLYFSKCSFLTLILQGEIPLVVEADSADVIATLLILKKEIEVETGVAMRLTIYGGVEAHLLAKELGDQNVGVILSHSRPFPGTWDQRRM